jgi:ABC-type nitrate/sulfonate/bicarbonate transport system substrate-binding protein
MKMQGFPGRTLSFLLVLLLLGCGESDTPTAITLKLSWKHGVDFLGFYAAQSQGYYADENLNVTIEPLSDPAETNSVFERVAAGEFDFSAFGLSLVKAQARGVPVTAIANINKFSPGTFFARADTGIVTPADLAGRRVVVKGETWRGILEQVLAREGLSLADVDAVPGGFDMAPFLEGKVEVWAGFINDEVVRARQQGLKLVTLPLHEYGYRTVALSIFTGQKALAADPDRAESFLRASLRGWAWALDHPTEAVDSMLALFPEMAAERDFHLASFNATIPLIRPPGTRLGEIDCESWRDHTLLVHLESTEALCTTGIYEAAEKGSRP